MTMPCYLLTRGTWKNLVSKIQTEFLKKLGMLQLAIFKITSDPFANKFCSFACFFYQSQNGALNHKHVKV
jgi:hypothetical protein